MDQGYSRKSGKEFTNIAKDYDKGRISENVDFWAKETVRLTGIDEKSLVLDLGCGTGIYTIGIEEETGARLCGMDPVPRMLRQARVKKKNIDWFNAVGEYLPIRAGIFNCIFSSQVWHHIEDKQATADECGRVIMSRGRVVIRTISHDQLEQKVVFDYFPEIKDNQLKVYPSNEDFVRYFKDAGFRETEFFDYSLERYQSIEDMIDIARGKLWSMFRPITEEGLEAGIRRLERYHDERAGAPLRNDELITLVVSRK
jgi:ubiquinone/menaquinone biosynthesis C-methylase UbiE